MSENGGKIPILPGYEIIKKLGQGGMASVYLARQKTLNRLVAIKILIPEIFGERRWGKRFMKEAETLSQLKHLNIVSIYDVGITDACYHIVMEYLDSSLKDRLRLEKQIPPAEALFITRQLADALFYVHRQGIIHRDIKPENILFRDKKIPVLLDFGIAKALDSRTKLTQTGISIGTPRYMSPEQCSGGRIDGRSDIYSLGVVLYEMLTGKAPYPSRDARGTMLKHVNDPVPTFPPELADYQNLLNRMMQKERKDRLNSFEEFAELIRQIGKTRTVAELEKTIPDQSPQKQAPGDIEKTVARDKIRPEKEKTPSTLVLKNTQANVRVFMRRVLAWFLFLFLLFIIFKWSQGYSPLDFFRDVGSLIAKGLLALHKLLIGTT